MDDRTLQKDITSPSHKIKWGTAILGPKPLINIHVGSPIAEPIQINLTQPVILGRNEENDPNMQINLTAFEAAQRGVSRRHASLEKVDKMATLTDLNSKNGTFLNGHLLFGNQRRILRDGDEIRLAQLVMYIYYVKPTSEDKDARIKSIIRHAHDLE